MSRRPVSGAGNDVMIGGLGRDILVGAFGDDLVVTGRYAGEDDLALLNAVFENWRQGRDASLLEAAGALLDDGVADIVALLGGGHRVFSNANDLVVRF